MGFFSFIESFFFISLAITFVLIMMIIYHFKQRIGVVEKKTETTVEILNNLAKEMNVLRGFVFNMNSMNSMGSMGSSPFFSVSGSEEREMVNNITIDLNDNIQIEHLDINEEPEEEEEESDEDSDEDDDDEDDDDINVNEIVSNSIERVVVSDNESEIVPETEPEPEPEPESVSEPEQIVEEISISDEIVQTEDYSKLTTSQLKNIVSDKKLHSGNVNKLKRNELLQLLQ